MANKNNEIQTTITEEIPDWKIRLVYFYTEHKTTIKRALVFSVFFLDLIIVFVFGSAFVNYRTGLISDEKYLSDLPKNLVNNNVASQLLAPSPLIFGTTKALRSTDRTDNLLLTVKNENTDWAVKKLVYTIEPATQDAKILSTFILPQSEKNILYFNVPSGSGASIKIIETEWERIRDFSLASYKDAVKVESAEFIPSQSSVVSGQVKIKIFNDTPFSFWEVGLPVVLYDSSGEPISANYTVINKLKSLEEREVSLGWSDDLFRTVFRAGVYPEINLLDNSSLMRLDPGPGSPPGLEIKKQ